MSCWQRVPSAGCRHPTIRTEPLPQPIYTPCPARSHSGISEARCARARTGIIIYTAQLLTRLEVRYTWPNQQHPGDAPDGGSGGSAGGGGGGGPPAGLQGRTPGSASLQATRGSGAHGGGGVPPAPPGAASRSVSFGGGGSGASLPLGSPRLSGGGEGTAQHRPSLDAAPARALSGGGGRGARPPTLSSVNPTSAGRAVLAQATGVEDPGAHPDRLRTINTRTH